MTATTVPVVALDPVMRRALARDGARQQAATKQRDARIIAAHKAGASLREIAEAVGLSHVGVKKIIDRQAG